MRDFGTGTKGFASVSDPTTAVCLLPGTELAFDKPITSAFLVSGKDCFTARFAQINKDDKRAHHDQLLLSDDRMVLLTHLQPGQTARVLQLPPAPTTKKEAEEQRRVEYAG